MFDKTYQWMGKKVYSSYATPFLALLFYIEAICFLPTDPMLIVYCIERKQHAWYYALVATLASVAGGITGYGIGAWLWNAMGDQVIHSFLLRLIIKPESFLALRSSMSDHSLSSLFLTGIPPIPYKAATLTAGFCHISLLWFIIFSIFIRGIRFFGIAAMSVYWGDSVKYVFENYSSYLALCGISIIVIIFWWYSS